MIIVRWSASQAVALRIADLVPKFKLATPVCLLLSALLWYTVEARNMSVVREFGNHSFVRRHINLEQRREPEPELFLKVVPGDSNNGRNYPRPTLRRRMAITRYPYFGHHKISQAELCIEGKKPKWEKTKQTNQAFQCRPQLSFRDQKRRFFLTPAPEAIVRFSSSRRRFAFASSVSSSLGGFSSVCSFSVVGLAVVGEGPGFFAWFGDERVVCCRVVCFEDGEADVDGDGVASESVPLFPVGSSVIATSSVGFPAAFFLDEEG